MELFINNHCLNMAAKLIQGAEWVFGVRLVNGSDARVFTPMSRDEFCVSFGAAGISAMEHLDSLLANNRLLFEVVEDDDDYYSSRSVDAVYFSLEEAEQHVRSASTVHSYSVYSIRILVVGDYGFVGIPSDEVCRAHVAINEAKARAELTAIEQYDDLVSLEFGRYRLSALVDLLHAANWASYDRAEVS